LQGDARDLPDEAKPGTLEYGFPSQMGHNGNCPLGTSMEGTAMNRLIGTAFAGLLAGAMFGTGSASAQFTFPFRPPAYGPGYQTQLSPYLNMLRGGDPAANFFIGVNPEFQRRQDRNVMYNSLQGMFMQLPMPPGINEVDLDAPMVSTGHPTAFNYTGMYFNSTMMGQGAANPFPQRRMGMQQQRPGGQRPGPMGQGGGGSGVWPNMMPGMGGGGGMMGGR
jgi:hypothetical protein